VEEQFAPGLSTPSQTAWGSLALLASGNRGSLALQKAAQYLIDAQRDDGEWDESLATGTGFPNVFYLRYTLYRLYFPVLALRQAQLALAG
jgi:squalene-hopene/tetraprenyl-beta-curcumene cyclase